MAETETPAEHPKPAAAPKRRRAPARRKASSRKAPARRKKAPGRARATARSLSALLAKAAAAGKGLKTLSGQGTDAARQALRDAGAASKKTIARLAKEWEGMDAKRRTQFVAALLATLAAASAPIVRSRMKK